jgi:hypothetical protein
MNSTERDLVILHTSTPSFNQDIRTAAADQGAQPEHRDRLRRRQGRSRAGQEPCRLARHIDFVAREEYDFTIVEIAEGLATGAKWTASRCARCRWQLRAPTRTARRS